MGWVACWMEVKALPVNSDYDPFKADLDRNQKSTKRSEVLTERLMHAQRTHSSSNHCPSQAGSCSAEIAEEQ